MLLQWNGSLSRKVNWNYEKKMKENAKITLIIAKSWGMNLRLLWFGDLITDFSYCVQDVSSQVNKKEKYGGTKIVVWFDCA